MTSQEFKEKLKKLPDTPGVYFFLGPKKHILYIGKATSLCDRVRSYFAPDLLQTRGRLIVDMVALSEDIDFTQTDSVLEALLLEANLIKNHQPKYNTKEKDNKSYNYIAFTNEVFPKVVTVRGRSLLIEQSQSKKYKYIFGPFPHGAQLREAMKIIRRIFPFSDNKCVPAEALAKVGKIPRPCFNRQIGLCPGVCTGEVSEDQYKIEIQNLKLLFEGKKKDLLKSLEKQMNDHAKKQDFEKAAYIRKTMFALNHIQDIALLKVAHKIDESVGGGINDSFRSETFRIEAYDVAHSSGTSVVGVMVVVEDEEVNKSQYRKFRIKINPGVNDTGALKEILRRRLGHLEWSMPNIIVVDGGQAQLNAAESVLKERGITIDLVSVVKDERHKPRAFMGDEKVTTTYSRAILLANSEAHRFAITYHRKKRDRIG
ncbi:MAG: UvrB/UvrC motif-containing protein [bacterium]|nr:UvrB/UvrC motif-containing protein [bacterium]